METGHKRKRFKQESEEVTRRIVVEKRRSKRKKGVKQYRPAREMEVILKDGNIWICDKGVDPEKDLKEQGCWQYGGTEMPFTRND